MLLSIRQYASKRGVSHTAVNEAVKAGKIPLVDGKIDPAMADIAWEERRDARQPSRLAQGKPSAAKAPERSEQPDTGTFAHAQLIHERAKAKKASLEAQRMDGKLLDAEEVRESVAGMVIAARAKLLVLGDELADALAAMSDPIACRELVDNRIAEALEALAA